MDHLIFYRRTIQKILTEYHEISCRTPDTDGIDTILALDEQRDQYFWLRVGWNEGDHITNMMVYIRIKDGKIYIEQDWTEEGMATELLGEGIPPEDIVLAFQPPEMRQHTEFALA
ncbi:MAG: XisI protein [Spirulinaceae cyanobacterium]